MPSWPAVGSIMRRLSKHYGLCLLPLLIAAFGVLALLPDDGHAESIAWNDTVIDTEVRYNNTTIVIKGNLTIAEGGNLELMRCDLVMNASLPAQYTIDVHYGGRLFLDRTNVTSGQGSFRIRTSHWMFMSRCRLSGLYRDDTHSGEYGMVVDGGQLIIHDLDIDIGDFSMRILGKGTRVGMSGGHLSGPGPIFLLEDRADIRIVNSIIGGSDDGPMFEVRSGAEVKVESSEFILRSSQGIREVAVVQDPHSRFWIEKCRATPPSEVSVFTMADGELIIDNRDGNPAEMKVKLTSILANLTMTNVTLVQSSIQGGTSVFFEVLGAESGYFEDCILHSYGTSILGAELTSNVTLHQFFRADFQLLNETRTPTPGLFLVVETRDGVEVADTVSGEGGWVRGVWLRSWTRHGDVFSYEPPHRVEFGDVDFSITSVQVFGNATVVVWNSIDQRDLSLVPEAVDVTDRSPREGDPFDVVVDGRRLVPYAYDSGNVTLKLSVDGFVMRTQVLDVRERHSVNFYALNLTEGLHELAIRVDPDDGVLELNVGGNDEVRVIVEVASRNYTGFEVDLYVKLVRLVDTGGDDGEPLAPGVIQVEYAAHARYSSTVVRAVKVAVYVDGAEWNAAWVDLTRLVDGEYVGSGRMPVNLPAGTFTIELRVDPSGDFDERYENNNVDSRSVRVEEPPVEPFLDLWDQPLLCLAMGAVGVLAAAYMYRRARGPAVPVPPSATPPAPSAREIRTDLVGYPCPQCGRGRLTGYADGSALCQDCKAVIAPRK